MDSITKLENTYTRNQLYCIIIAKSRKLKNVFKTEQTWCSKTYYKVLEKKKEKNESVGRLYNLYDSIFSTDKPDETFNKFKYESTICSTEKPLQEISRKYRNNIEVRDSTTKYWHNMVHNYEMGCESEKNDLINKIFT